MSIRGEPAAGLSTPTYNPGTAGLRHGLVRETFKQKKHRSVTGSDPPVLPSRKSDLEISKSDFYQIIFLPKIRPKADPNSLF